MNHYAEQRNDLPTVSSREADRQAIQLQYQSFISAGGKPQILPYWVDSDFKSDFSQKPNRVRAKAAVKHTPETRAATRMAIKLVGESVCAKSMGITEGHVHKMMKGRNAPSRKRALELEALCDGQVTAAAMRGEVSQ